MKNEQRWSSLHRLDAFINGDFYDTENPTRCIAMQKLPLCLMLLFCAPAYAQEPFLDLLFESAPSTRPAGSFLDGEGWDHLSISRWDANNDGIDDLITVETDEQGNPIGINAIDMTTQTLISHVHVPEEFPVLLRGYGVFIPDDFPVLIFGGDGVVLVDQATDETVFSLDPAHQFVRFTDMNGDGLANLVIRNTQAQTVQIWGFSDN